MKTGQEYKDSCEIEHDCIFKRGASRQRYTY